MDKLIHFVDTGGASDAPTLVFVHGFGCALGDWAAQYDFFKARYRCIACDLPGHGDTPPWPEHNRIAAMGADVAKLLTSLVITDAVLVGHSMGCRVVLQAALDEPTRVAGLGFMDGSWIGQGDPDTVRAGALRVFNEQTFSSMVTQLFGEMFNDDTFAELREGSIARAAARPARYATELFADLQAWDARFLQASIRALGVPSIAIQSTYLNAERQRVSINEGNTTPWLDLLRAERNDADIAIVPNAGHFNMIEKPDEVNAHLDAFLKRLT
ncbi:MAG: alpha/beta hydrolase [Pseudomonadota bacterium]